jgi:hypothetical protein
MADNLDKWIKDSKVEAPDSGEFRRLNRVLLKDRMATVIPARRRRFRLLLVMVTLVLLLLVSGQISHLGSDSFETKISTEYCAALDDTVIKATGLSYGGKTSWLKYVTRDINGRENTEGRATENPPSQEPENILQFLQEHYRDLVARTKIDPSHATQRLTLDGILFEFEIWTYEYPGFGEVTRYVGFPVS